MHMRKKKWAIPELSVCPFYIDQPASLKGHWRDRFATGRPLHVELGCGKGVSTAQMAFHQQDTDFVAIDITSNVLGDAKRNIESAYALNPVNNILLARLDITRIETVFGPEDAVSRIYIQFCNPWTHRKRTAKRRLTHPRQLMQYRSFLTEQGEIWFKTDCRELFEDSCTYFEVSGFRLRFCTEDLHRAGFSPNYISEHERKFSDLGLPIYFGCWQKDAVDPGFDPVRWSKSVEEAGEE